MSANWRPKLYSPKVRMFNCIWVFTLGDRDDNPSVPHAHDRVHGYRLNAWTGEIYPAGRDRKNIIGTLSKKERRRLYTDIKFLNFAQKQIEWYQKEFPRITFFIPDWFRAKCLMKRTEVDLKRNTIEEYTFIGEAQVKL